ncbi:MAG: transporter substrate-binding domain-containing protein [Clostridia bacterium]|nr:transporter substrate-binding domain-containing protein [Clostridia bacterium]
MAGKRFRCLLICLFLFGMVLTAAPAASAEARTNGGKGIASLDELAGADIAVQTGMICDVLAQQRIENVKIQYYNAQTDALIALETGKARGWCCDEPVARYMGLTHPDVVVLEEELAESDLAAVFPKTEKGQKLRDQYSAFVDGLWADGTMAAIDAVWFSTDEEKRTVLDYSALPDTNGTLIMTTDTTIPPFSFVKDGRPMGYDIDVAARFCQANGYRLQVVQMSFDSILAAVQTGKCDFAASSITITDERKESVLFSTPDYRGGVVMAVLKEASAAAPEKTTFWSGIASSFEKTFLREDRWRLFADGTLTSLIIAVLSILLGTLLGFGVYMMCRKGNPLANGVTRFCMWIVQGMPVVVLLMILYYIVFGSVSVSGVIVAVAGFTLTFGSTVFSLLKMGVGTIDRGQYEASFTLGFSDRTTFYRIILPQALPHILPAYKSEIVTLIKATAVVGYIAVQDLTKMGDIVRSRTYEAFFPLIAVTVIYFLLEGLLAFLVSRIQIRVNPKRRKAEDILKGVNPDDKN